MATQINAPIKHFYTEINKGKFKSVKHFELTDTKNGTPQLSTLLNISKDRNCAQSMPEYWVQVREGKKWKKPRLTGLFKTDINNLYKGDCEKRKHLLLFQFSEQHNKLTVYYFKNHFTKNLNEVYPLINL